MVYKVTGKKTRPCVLALLLALLLLVPATWAQAQESKDKKEEPKAEKPVETFDERRRRESRELVQAQADEEAARVAVLDRLRAPLDGLDEYIEAALKEWEVPGLALAVVKDDKVILARGYGTRVSGEDEPVDGQTVFAIGSASKAFTTTALAMLVEKGKLNWGDKATQHLEHFQLNDPYVTRELTVADILTHRSGLSRGDLLWYASDFTRDEILERVRHLEPTWSFRSTFGYQNIMYLAGGQIIPALTDSSWDTFVREKIFFPLEMVRTNCSVTDLIMAKNVAQPHGRIDDVVTPIAWRNIDNVGPAGSINSNAEEMAQWVRLHLGNGTYNGKQILKPETVSELHTPQTIIRIEGRWKLYFGEANFLTYGLGWFLHDYKGKKVVEHGGNIDGMSALVAMMPEENLGLVALTNLGGNILPSAVRNRIFDAFLKEEPTDWSKQYLTTLTSARKAGEAEEKKLEAARITDTHPSLPLEKYAGTFVHEMYGDLSVIHHEGKLILTRSQALVADLQHWHVDTFRVIWRDRQLGKALAEFRVSGKGEVTEVSLPDLAKFERKEKKEPEAVEPDEDEDEARKRVPLRRGRPSRSPRQ